MPKIQLVDILVVALLVAVIIVFMYVMLTRPFSGEPCKAVKIGEAVPIGSVCQ